MTHIDEFIGSRNYEIVLQLIRAHPSSLDQLDSDGFSILHYAIMSKNVELVQILCEIGCDVKKMTADGKSCISLAVSGNCSKILSYLVNYHDFDVEDSDIYSESPLITAIDIANPNIIDILIGSGTRLDTPSFIAKYNCTLTPLAYCIKEKKIATISLIFRMTGPLHNQWNRIALKIIELDDNFAMKALLEYDGGYPLDFNKLLFEISIHNSYKCAQLLENYNFDFLKNVSEKLPAIYYSIVRGNLEMCQFFIHKYIDEKLLTPELCLNMIHNSCKQKNSEITQLFLQCGIDPNIRASDSICPIHTAVVNNLPMTVQCLIRNGSEINATTDSGFTPLHIAMTKDLIEIAKILVENQADIHIRDMNGNTAIHSAAKFESVKCLKFLLSNIGTYDIESNNKGETILDIAVSNGSIRMVQVILAEASHIASYIHPAIENSDKSKCFMSRTLEAPLIIAIKDKNYEIIKLLLKYGCDPNSQYDALEEKNPLAIAIDQDDIEAVQCLILNSPIIPVNLNYKNIDEKAAIHIAMDMGNLKILEYLISMGCDVYITDNLGNNILHYIAQHLYDCKVLNYLIDKLPCDIINRLQKSKNNNGFLPIQICTLSNNFQNLSLMFKNLHNVQRDINFVKSLGLMHYASARNATECLDYLIINNKFKKSDYNDPDGYTPLHFACVNDCLQSLELLMKNFPKMLRATTEKLKLNPLHICAQFDSINCAKYIIEYHGSSLVNSKTSNRFTPLHIASYFRSEKCIKLFISSGSQLDSVSKTNATPLQLATISKCSSIILELLDIDPFSKSNNSKSQNNINNHIYSEFKAFTIDMMNIDDYSLIFKDHDPKLGDQFKLCSMLKNISFHDSNLSISKNSEMGLGSHNKLGNSSSIDLNVQETRIEQLFECNDKIQFEEIFGIRDQTNCQFDIFDSILHKSDMMQNMISDSNLLLSSDSPNSDEYHQESQHNEHSKCYKLALDFLENEIEATNIESIGFKEVIEPSEKGMLRLAIDNGILLIIPPYELKHRKFSNFTIKLNEMSLSKNIIDCAINKLNNSTISLSHNYHLNHILNLEASERNLPCCIHITMPLSINLPSNNFYLIAFQSSDCISWTYVDERKFSFKDLISYKPQIEELLSKGNITRKHFGFVLNYLYKYITFILVPKFKKIPWEADMNSGSEPCLSDCDSPYSMIHHHIQDISIGVKHIEPKHELATKDHQLYYCELHLKATKLDFIERFLEISKIIYTSNMIIVTSHSQTAPHDDHKPFDHFLVSIHKNLRHIPLNILIEDQKVKGNKHEILILHQPDSIISQDYDVNNDTTCGIPEWNLVNVEGSDIIQSLEYKLTVEHHEENYIKFEAKSRGSYIFVIKKSIECKSVDSAGSNVFDDKCFAQYFGSFFTNYMLKPKPFHSMRLLKKENCEKYTIALYPQFEESYISAFCNAANNITVFIPQRSFSFYGHLDFQLRILSKKDATTEIIMDRMFKCEALNSALYIELSKECQRSISEHLGEMNCDHNQLIIQIFQYPLKDQLEKTNYALDLPENYILNDIKNLPFCVLSEIIKLEE